MNVWKGIGIFALGTLFGFEGIKLLCSKDAKKVYAHCTAGALRAKDSVLDQVTTLRENCSDIYEEAKAINEERARKEKEAEIDDAEETDDVEETEECESEETEKELVETKPVETEEIVKEEAPKPKRSRKKKEA